VSPDTPKDRCQYRGRPRPRPHGRTLVIDAHHPGDAAVPLKERGVARLPRHLGHAEAEPEHGAPRVGQGAQQTGHPDRGAAQVDALLSA
jgi:hypothetical protein